MIPLHACWIDAGNDPNYAKLTAHGIDTPYFSPLDSRVTASYLNGVIAVRGMRACGLYVVWNWWPEFADPAAFAVWTDAQLRRIAWPGNPAVCVDIEKGANGVTSANLARYVVAFLQRWRQLRPTRPTWVTIEGFQGGNFDPASVAAIQAANVRLAPQFYAGNMGGLGHSVILDLLIEGFPGERIDGMYDAAALPYSWRGFAFTQGRLP